MLRKGDNYFNDYVVVRVPKECNANLIVDLDWMLPMEYIFLDIIDGAFCWRRGMRW